MRNICFFIFIAGGVIAMSAAARAADDSARFNGKWKAAFFYNGVWVNLVSVHDAAGYKNYVILPQGSAPIGDGKFSAADGKWTTSAAAPNNSGTYQFMDANTVVCQNAIGQPLTWQRDNTPLPPVIGVAEGNSLPAGTNFAAVKTTQAVEVCRKIAQAWHSDAALVCVNVFGPNPDGTVNILANPQAFTITFGSPSTMTAFTLVSALPTGSFVPNPGARLPTVDYLPIGPQALDLTDAYKSVRLFGFTGPISQARLYYGHENGKPERLVWSLDAGGAYPWIVSGASGAILSPFEVLDDKVADYNKLAAQTQAAVAANLRSRQRHPGAQGAGGTWLESGMHFWSAEGNGGGGGSGGSSGGEEDTWDNEVAAQNAWEDGNSGAEARIDAGEPTVEDQTNYGASGGE
jgi:hypothetical protein